MHTQNKKSISMASFLLGVHFLVLFYFIFQQNNQDIYWAAALFTFIVALPYLGAVLTHSYTWYEGHYLFLAGWYTTHGFYFLFPFDPNEYGQGALLYVLQAASIGALAFMGGYALQLGGFLARKLPLRAFMSDFSVIRRLPVTLYAFYFIGRTTIFLYKDLPTAYFFPLHTITRLTIYMGIMIDLYGSFMLHGQASLFAKRRQILARASIFIVIESFFCFLSGFLSTMLPLVTIVILVYLKARQRLNFFLVSSLVVFVFLYISLLLPFTKAFREQYWTGSSFTASLNYAIENINLTQEAERRTASISRAANAIQIASIAYSFRQQGITIAIYQNTADFLSRFIPRFIWPDKPFVDYAQIGRQLGILQDDDYTTAIGIPLLASLIMSGGFFGVAVGMFAVGIIIRIFWEWLIVRGGGDFLPFCIYSIVLYTWMMGGDEIAILLHSSLGFLAYTYLFLNFFLRRKKS